MKKFFAIFIVVMSAFMVTACNNEVEQSSNNSAIQNESSENVNDDNNAVTFGETLFKDGLVAVEQNNSYGYMDVNGNYAIPCVYADASNFYNGVAFVRTEEGMVYSINSKGEKLATMDEKAMSIVYAGEFPYNVDMFLLAYQYELIDQNGNLLCDFPYELVSSNLMDEGYVKIFTQGDVKNQGFYDLNEQKVLIAPGEYDAILAVPESESLFTKKDDKNYLLDFDGKIIMEWPYSTYIFFNCGLACLKDENTGLFGYVDKTGEFVISPKYVSVGNFSNGVAAVSLTEGTSYLIDSNGQQVSASYDSISEDSYEGFFVVFLNGKEGIINCKGEEVIPPENQAVSMRLNGYFCTINQNRLTYFDQTGKKLLEYSLPSSYKFRATSGIYDDGYIKLRVQNEDGDGVDGIINKDGELVLGFNYNIQ